MWMFYWVKLAPTMRFEVSRKTLLSQPLQEKERGDNRDYSSSFCETIPGSGDVEREIVIRPFIVRKAM
jgi:hypothetical protein